MMTGDIDIMMHMIDNMIKSSTPTTKDKSKDGTVSFAKELEQAQKNAEDSVPNSIQLTLQKGSTQAPFNLNQSATCVDCDKTGKFGEDIKQYKDCDNLVLCAACHDKRVHGTGD